MRSTPPRLPRRPLIPVPRDLTIRLGEHVFRYRIEVDEDGRAHLRREPACSK